MIYFWTFNNNANIWKALIQWILSDQKIVKEQLRQENIFFNLFASTLAQRPDIVKKQTKYNMTLFKNT